MTYRLYFWFKGAPEDRPGGPWWYRDFAYDQVEEFSWEHSHQAARATFFKDVEPFLHKWSFVEGEKLLHHDPAETSIHPPKTAVVHFSKIEFLR